MPVGFSSPARNLFLLGSSGAQVVTNFFKTIDQSAGTDGSYEPDEIKYNEVDQKFVLAGSAEDSNSKGFGWFEKRDDAGTADWDVRIEAGAGINTTLRAMELDSNDNLIVVGKSGNAPWIAKYSNGGVIDWQATTFSGDVEYTGVTSDANGNYYACGNTTLVDKQAFVEKFDTNGNPGWGKSAFMLGRSVVLRKIAANSRGEVVAVGYLYDEVYYKGYIVKIDTNTGEVLWDRTLEQADQYLECTDVFIDGNDQIYITAWVGNYFTASSILIKYTAEGNIIWQKQTNNDTSSNETILHHRVKSDTETEQTIVFGTHRDGNGNEGGVLSKYSKNGDLVWRRTIFSSYNNSNNFGVSVGKGIALDADPSFYYLLYVDDAVNGLNGTPDSYTYGKVSSSGNGLGDFQYAEGTGETIDYQILSIGDTVGRLSDGSVRNDTSDLLTYPFNGTKILFDDLATQVTNKKRQMDSADSFEYSGSPAIRPTDFQELNLLGDVYSGSGDWLDQSGKGNNAATTVTTTAEEPFSGAGAVQFDGDSDSLTVTASTDFTLDGEFTVEFWIYLNTIALDVQHPSPITFSQSGSNTGQVYLNASSNYFSLWNGSSNIVNTGNNSVTTGTWYHVAVTRDSSNNCRIFLDGVLKQTASSTFTFGNASGDLRIGSFNGTGGDVNGYISNLRVIKGTALYTSNFTPPTTSLTAITNTVLLTCQGNTISPGTDIVVTTSNQGSGSTGSLSAVTSSGNYYFDNRSASPSTASIQLDFKTVQTSVTEIKLSGGGYVAGALFDLYVNGVLVENDRSTVTLWGEDTITISSTNISSIKIEGSDGYSLGALKFNGTLVSGTIAEIVPNGDVAPTSSNVNGPTHNAAGYWEFSGTDNHIISGPKCNTLFEDGGSGTIEMWVRPQLAGARQTLCSGYLSSGSTQPDRWDFEIRNNNTLGGGSHDNSFFTGTTSLSTNTWYHFVFTLDKSSGSGTLKAYINAVEEVTQNFTLDRDWATDVEFGIGNRYLQQSDFPLNADVGEVRIYPRALTAAQIFQNYNATKETYTGVAASTNPGLTSTRTP